MGWCTQISNFSLTGGPASASSCCGPGNTIVSATGATGLNWPLSMNAGTLDGSTFTLGNSYNEYDNGESPYISIDPNGLLLEIHQTNAFRSNTIYANIGTVTGGKVTLSTQGSIKTDMGGTGPAIAAVGPNTFIVAASGPLLSRPPQQAQLWLVNVNQTSTGYEVLSQPISYNAAYAMTYTATLCYYNGTLAVGGISGGEVTLGTLNGTTYVVKGAFNIQSVDQSPSESYSVLLGPNNTIFIAQSDSSTLWDWIGVSGGTINTSTSPWTVDWQYQNVNIYSVETTDPAWNISLSFAGNQGLLAVADEDSGYRLFLLDLLNASEQIVVPG